MKGKIGNNSERRGGGEGWVLQEEWAGLRWPPLCCWYEESH